MGIRLLENPIRYKKTKKPKFLASVWYNALTTNLHTLFSALLMSWHSTWE